MKKNSRLPRLAAGVLVIAALLGAALAAGQQGSQSDPLITLSYLEQKAKPDILAQVDKDLTAQTQALTEKLQAEAAAVKKELEDKLAQGGNTGTGFTAVNLSAGQRLTAEPGCEILVRSGSVLCFASASPGFMDLTSGGVLENGASPSANHLYVAPAENSGFSASSAALFLIRGSYSLG